MSVSVCVHNDNEPDDINSSGDYVAVLVIRELENNMAVKTISSGEAYAYDVARAFALQVARFAQETPDPDETIAQFNVALDDLMKEVLA